MDKKSYVIKVLEKLQSDWPMAAGLLVLVQNSQLTDSTLDAIFGILRESIKQVEEGKLQEKLQKSKDFVQKLKDTESKQQSIDQQSLDQLDDMLKNI